MVDPVHHELNVLSAEHEVGKPKVSNHLAGAAGSPVVSSDNLVAGHCTASS